MLKVREAAVKDAAVLWRAEAETAATSGQLISTPEELDLRAFESKIAGAVGRGTYVVAEVDGVVRAHALIDPMPLAAVRHVYRLTVVAHPYYTGCGLGTALISHLQGLARSHPEIGKIELLARSTNTRALKLYSRMGFVEEGRLRDRVRLTDGTFIDDVAMAWFPVPTRHRWLSRQETIAFDREWRAALSGRGLKRVATGADALVRWQGLAARRVLVAATDGSRTAELSLYGDLRADPSPLLDELNLDDAFFFPPDLSWAIHADHDGTRPVELFERDAG